MNPHSSPGAKENEKMTSKNLENALRFIAFSKLGCLSCENAFQFVRSCRQSKCVSNVLDSGVVSSILSGVRGELYFFVAFQDRLKLTPTLDAGCAYDFVGEVKAGEKLLQKINGRFVRIDVTTNIETKREKGLTVCNGQTKWPFLVAHVRLQGMCIDWYDEAMTCVLDSWPFDVSSTPIMAYAEHLDNDLVMYAKLRRMSLEPIETNQGCCFVSNPFATFGTHKFDRMLDAHLAFFSSYKYALNIVPALSYGDLCDFIGEHDGELVRYRVLTSLDGYYEKERLVIEQLSKNIKYMIALYDAQTKMFKFFDWDSCVL